MHTPNGGDGEIDVKIEDVAENMDNLRLGGMKLEKNWILMFKLDCWVCWVFLIFLGLLMNVMKGDGEFSWFENMMNIWIWW